MPYLPLSQKDLDDEKKKSQEDGNPVLLNTGSSSVINPTDNSAQNGQRQASSSGRYTNIQSYLNANKEQAEGLSSQMSDNIKGEADKANQAIDSSRNNFQQAVNSNTTRYDSDLVNRAVADPTSVANDENAFGQIQKQRTASYGGPSDITEESGWATAATQANKAKNYADQSGSEYGRYTLLGEMFGRPSYQQGQKKLDNLLVQNDKTASDKLSQAASYATPVTSRINESLGWGKNVADQGKAATAETRANTTKALSDADLGFQSQLNNRVTEAQGRLKSGQDSLTQDLSDDALTDDTLSQLGLSEGQGLYNTSLANYLSFADPSNIKKENVASLDDYAKYAALAKLQGIDPTYLIDSTKDMAGKFDRAVNFDRARFEGDLAGAKSQYEAQLTPLTAKVAEEDQRAAWLSAEATKLEKSRDEQDRIQASSVRQWANEAAGRANAARGQITNLQNTFGVNRKVSRQG